ncbi:MAG: metallophosphoesterase family protein [Thermodesulfobacteriota bacterium]|nr:metallophosphoesterase family protein [Thermodesulfobacteriota bacterium]
MKIGVISDTHLIQATRLLEDLMTGAFKDAEMIVHAGDITELTVLETFGGKKVLAVCGNMDSPAVRRQLPVKQDFFAGKFRIGLVHGWGGPQGIEERINREFDQVDCIIYGHTHIPSQIKRERILFFNPGAFGGGLYPPKKSVGLLDIGETISGQIVYL